MRKCLLLIVPVAVVSGCVREIVRVDAPAEPVLGGGSELTADETRLLAEREMSVKLAPDELNRIIADVMGLLGEAGAETRGGATGGETGAGTRAETRGGATGGETGAGTRAVAEIRPLMGRRRAPGATSTSRASSGEGGEGGEGTSDTLFHVVDFADRRGYCVIAADRRLPEEIVCFVGHGSFPAALSGENPGLALMMDAAYAWARRSIDRHVAWSDSVTTALLTRTGASSLDRFTAASTRTTERRLYEPTWHLNRRLGPLVPVEWSQRAPFNMTVVENTPWSTTPVGCVALAAAQVMAYWKHPTQFHDLADDRIDWDGINRWTGPNWLRENRYRDWDGPMSAAPDSTKRLVADLLWHLGDDIDMHYTASVSTAYTSRVMQLMAEHGFSRARMESYSGEEVRASIEKLHPVIIDGASHWAEDGPYYDNAHAWVIDGYLEQRRWDGFTIDRHRYEIEKFRGFFHNNFGWGGDDNGWYSCGVFDANNGPDLQSNSSTRANPNQSTRAVEWQGENYNYQFLLTVYVDLYVQL